MRQATDDRAFTPLMWFVFWGFQAYLIIFMFYVFGSGGIQPSHFWFVLLFGLTFTTFPRTAWGWRSYIKMFIPFWVFVTFVNFGNAILFPDNRLLLAPMYYFYNIMVFTLTLHLMLLYRTQFIRAIGMTCIIALFLQLAFLMAGFGIATRSEGTFNNPNQLGYWSLMIITLYGVVRQDETLSLQDFVVTFLALICATFSLSKAAMLAIIVTLFIVLLQKVSLHRLVRTVSIIPLGILIVYFIATYFLGDILMDIINSASYRISNIGNDSDDNAAGRNYDRIWRWPHYLFFGAGEGAYFRFTNGIKNNEIHSTLGMLLFSYGIIGFGLFFMFLLSFVTRAGWGPFLYFGPLFLYGITHQGLRSSLFWVFLGVLASYAAERRRPIT